MRCNAGRNYLFIEKNGTIHRCGHRMVKGEDMGWTWNESMVTEDPLPCNLCERCAAEYPSDFHRSSRYDETSGTFDQGGSACDPRSQLATMMVLGGGEGALTPDGWGELFQRFAKAYALSWHTVTGEHGEPMAYKGIARLIESMMFCGDQAYVMTNMSVREPVIVDVVRAANPAKVRFAAMLDTTVQGFDWLKFLGRTRLVKERGFDVRVLFAANALQLDQFDHYRDTFSSYGITTTLHRQPGVTLTKRQEDFIAHRVSSKEPETPDKKERFRGI